MNNPTKRPNNAVSPQERREPFSETVTPETGQGPAQIAGRGAILHRLMAGVKVLWARNGTDKSPGRDLEEMVLTYGGEAEPDRNDVPLAGKLSRTHLGYQPCPQLPRVTGYSPALEARVEEIPVYRSCEALSTNPKIVMEASLYADRHQMS